MFWTTDHPASREGAGVVVYGDGRLLDGVEFRRLRDTFGSWINTNDPLKVRQALGLPPGEPGIVRGGR